MNKTKAMRGNAKRKRLLKFVREFWQDSHGPFTASGGSFCWTHRESFRKMLNREARAGHVLARWEKTLELLGR